MCSSFFVHRFSNHTRTKLKRKYTHFEWIGIKATVNHCRFTTLFLKSVKKKFQPDKKHLQWTGNHLLEEIFHLFFFTLLTFGWQIYVNGFVPLSHLFEVANERWPRFVQRPSLTFYWICYAWQIMCLHYFENPCYISTQLKKNCVQNIL